MRVDKYTMAQSWMRQDDATPEEAKATWDTLETEFEDKRKAQLMASAETDAIIKTINDKFGPGTVFPASEAPIPPMTDTQRIMEWEDRNKYSNGQLVTPSGDGSRPGYSGVYERTPGSGQYRITGSRGGVNAEKWLHEHGYKTNFTNKKEAERVNKIFNDAHPKSLVDMGKDKWMTEIETLKEEFNKIVNKDFAKQNMSKTPTWKSFLEGKKLKHGSAGMYRSQAPNFGVLDSRKMKFELADILIEQSNNSLKHTPWMDIQKKLSKMSEINTTMYRSYIDKLDSQADKASKAFDYLLDNDVELKLPKNLSKTMAQEGSLLRKVIHDLTGVNTVGIRKGLNMNDAFNKNFDQLDFAARSNLITEGEGRTLKEIIDNADYRMKGNISWTSDIKRANRANKNVFDYALRNFNYHQLNKTGEGQIQFFYKKNNQPVDWNTLPKNKNGYRTLPPNDVYFIDSTDSVKNRKWDMTKIDADNMKWSKGTGSSGMFDEVFKAKDTYDTLLATKVTDPRSPKGAKISFGKLMSEVYQTGFDNFGNPYSLEHGDGIAKKPFNNIKIASQRINQALSSLKRKKNLTKSESNKILKELQKGVFNPESKNVVDNIIKSTSGLQQDVLVKGKTFDQPLVSEIQDYITGKSNKRPTFGSGPVLIWEQLMDEPMMKALTKSAQFKKFANVARGTTKYFGPIDLLIGFADYENELSKYKKADGTYMEGAEKAARKQALQTMSFGLWKGGDREKIARIKETFIASGGDGNVFDAAVAINENQNKISNAMDSAKENYLKNKETEKEVGVPGGAQAIKFNLDMPTAVQQMDSDVANIKRLATNHIDLTNKYVDVMGKDITVEQFKEPFSAIKQAGLDTAKKRWQENYKSIYDKPTGTLGTGDIGEKLTTHLFTTKAPEREEEKRLIEDMKAFDPKELYRYNKEFRNLTRDNPEANIELLMGEILSKPSIYGRYQDFEFKSNGGRTGSYFDGGIASLRRKK